MGKIRVNGRKRRVPWIAIITIYGGTKPMLIDRIALILTIVGAANWGSVGLFKFDIVAWLFGGQDAVLSRIIYALVALAGAWCISLLFRERVPAHTH